MARPAGHPYHWEQHAEKLHEQRTALRDERAYANSAGCLDARMDMLLGQAEAMIMSAEKRARANSDSIAREREKETSCPSTK